MPEPSPAFSLPRSVPCRAVLWVSLLAAASIAQASPPSRTGTVLCRGERHFRMQVDATQATVWVGRQVLNLRRSPADSMTRYVSSTAALAIDGDYVAFVMNDALDFEDCRLYRRDLADAPDAG